MDPGGLYVVTHDINVGGARAFKAGESVLVEEIAPNQDRPEYKYVVFSTSLQRRFQLSDGDLAVPVAAPSEPWSTAAPVLRDAPASRDVSASKGSSRSGTKSGGREKVLLIALVLAVVVAAGVVAYIALKKPPGPAATVKAFFAAGESCDVQGMIKQLDPVSYSQNPTQAARLNSNFGESKYGPSFAHGFKYTTETTGDNAKVIVKVNSSDVRDSTSPPNTMVTFAELDLVRKDGKWLITQFLMAW